MRNDNTDRFSGDAPFDGISMRKILKLSKEPQGAAEMTGEEQIRSVLEMVKDALRHPQPGIVPLQIPAFYTENAFYVFLVLLTEDDWMKKNTAIITFDLDDGSRGFGVVVNSDVKKYWQTQKGHAYLKTQRISVYSVEEYVSLVFTNLREERGIAE